METENGNVFFDNEDNYENGRQNQSGQGGYRREGRPRFVRTDTSDRPQYSKVDRQGGYRPRQEGGYQRREGGYQRPSYGQQRYGQDGQQRYGQEERPRFYRERMQGQEERQEGGYQRPEGGYQRRDNSYQRPEGGYRPRQEGGYQRQGGYQHRDGAYQRPEGGYQHRDNGYQRQEGGPQRQGGYGRPSGQQGYRKPAQRKQDSRKRISFQDVVHNPDEEIRLNKYLANAGVCSRREADDFILAGVVKVNGQTVTELGTKVKRGDNVLFHDQLVSIERKIYILLNKPKDCVTTVDDPQERKTVMDYIKGACKERVYPVGRLDRNTTGVLLLTNDGELATRLTHPKYLKKKIYHVRLERTVSADDMQKLLDGVNIGESGEEDIVRADEVSYVNDDKTQVGIEIHSGRNRVVRRMFDALGYHVAKLDRVQFAGLTKKRLRRGDWRFLTEKEVNMLRMGAYE